MGRRGPVRSFCSFELSPSIDRVVRQFHFHGWNPPPPEESTHQPSAAQWDGYGSRGQGVGGGGQQADRTRSNLPPTEGRWRGSQECPPPSARSTLLTLCDKVKQWQLEVSLDSTPILVHCRNGAQCSGLFVAASLMTSRMDEENLVSVYRTCRALRKLCPRAVGNFEQYKFQYKALWDYINQPPSGVGTRDCGVSSLDSPDPEYKRGWGETPTEESRRPSYQYGDSYSYRTPKSDLPPDRERHVCEIAEPTETEEEQTEGSATRVSDYYSVSTTPRPLLHHHQYHPHHQRYSSTTSASNNDAYNNHRFSPLQTSTRNRPRSSLAVSSYPAPSPSPLPRVRTHSLSPIHRSGGEPGYGYGYAPCTTPTTTTTTSPSRRRRREKEREMERRRRRRPVHQHALRVRRLMTPPPNPLLTFTFI
ncbi:uncharacterized protein LOC143289614 [Babylonia areolata]|uniref:uncharacterized protein LOC143289614 n=1 Tax=Babylonia areolata TaxID=304850 RepID=UPI003FD55FDA